MLGACAGGPGPARAGGKVGMLTLDWATVLTVVSTVVTALATAFLAVFTFVTLRYLRRQEDRAAQDRFDLRRPLLIPVSLLGIVDAMGSVAWGNRDSVVLMRNAGPGVALDIAALLLGPSDLSMNERYSAWSPTPLPPMAADQVIQFRSGASMISLQATIDAHMLCAPDRPSDGELYAGATWAVLRLTLTYRDIYRRKHAAIFNYTSMGRWETVAIVEDISKDLRDLEDDAQRGQAAP